MRLLCASVLISLGVDSVGGLQVLLGRPFSLSHVSLRAIPVDHVDVSSTMTSTQPQVSSVISVGNAIRENAYPTSWSASSSMYVSMPSDSDIDLLNRAMSAVYQERDGLKSIDLLGQCIEAWKNQPADERSALYRVRAAVYMDFVNNPELAIQDYNQALELLQQNPSALKAADPSELPAIRLGRARAMRSYLSIGGDENVSKKKASFSQAVEDYKQSFFLSARYDADYYENDEERELDGASKNPFAVWEYGMAYRGAEDYKNAANIHLLASDLFKDIGDNGRSIISALDAAIDMTAYDEQGAIVMLKDTIDQTTSVKSNDVPLLQRVIAKECEARVALASLLWSSNQKVEAEDMLGKASTRLDQLVADADARKTKIRPPTTEKAAFSIDDIPSAGQMSSSRFKNAKFVQDTLLWPTSLQEKLSKLYNLKK